MRTHARSIVALVVLLSCNPTRESGGPAPSESAAVPSAAAQPASAQPASAQPAAPHPDYPTPEKTGTSHIFLVEEPVRGPLPGALDWPEPKGLTTTEHAACEVEQVDVVCGPPPPTGPRAERWRVGRRGGRPILAERLAPGGALREAWIFRYRPDGTLAEVQEADGRRQMVAAAFFDEGGARFTRRNLDGSNALDGCGKLEVTREGRAVTGRRCLQWGGPPMRDMSGVHEARVRRDARGFIVEEARFDEQGAPVVGREGWHARAIDRDRLGRVAGYTHRDAAGGAGADGERGCPRLAMERDEAGAVVGEACLDAQGTRRPDLYGVVAWARSHDPRGCLISERALGDDGAAVATDYKVHARIWDRNDHCESVSKECRDTGRPIACGPGEPARTTWERDGRGWITSRKSWNEAGAPGRDEHYSTFEVRFAVDERGRVTSELCFDSSGAATTCGATGFHEKRKVVDDAGRVTEERFFAPGGAPATNLGTSLRRFTYDNYDHFIEGRSFGHDGEPMKDYAAMRTLWDINHRRVAVLLLDAAGRPARYRACFTGLDCPPRAWHALRIVRGAIGRATRNQFFDAEGQLVAENNCGSQRCFR